MAFNFPDGASNGDTHTASNGVVYRFDGTVWVVDRPSTSTSFDAKYLNTTGDGIVSSSAQITDGSGIISGSLQFPSGLISGSTQISESGFVSSSTTNVIEVMTSASYASITPVTGTLYIIQG